MAQSNQVKNYFKAPEGRYTLHCERGNGASFFPTRPVRLTLASIQHQGKIHNYVLYNLLDALAFCVYSGIDKQPARQIVVGSGLTGPAIYPTCHSWHPSPDNLDLIIGLSTGDIVVGSVKSQLQGALNNTKLLPMLHFNPEAIVDATRVVGVQWVPGTNATVFAAAHQSGNFYVYQLQSASIGSDSSPHSSKPGNTPAPKPYLTVTASSKGLNAMSVSPDGTKIASAGKDGVLYLHNLNTGQLLFGFKGVQMDGCVQSHYGGLTCCDWSPDSHYVASGGEDDLVCVFGVTEEAVVFWGEGHTSWVSQIAFDRWYRIASVGQDCQLLLWDFVVQEDDYLDLSLDELQMGPAQSNGAPGVHRRVPSASNVNGGHFSSVLQADSVQKMPEKIPAASLPPEIRPPAKRSEMLVSTPVTTQTIHSEPCSDILFMKEAVYTACYTGQLRCWRRPEKVPETASTTLDPQTTRHQ